MLRSTLDGLYRASGWLAALSLLAIAIVVVAQIVGRPFGIVVPSVPQMAGFFLAATIFLGLAYTLAEGEHIRVVILLERLPPRARWWVELWVATASLAVTGLLAVHTLQLAYESWTFADRADGLLPIPLVIPQGAMAFGVIVLFIRFLDETITLVRSGKVIHFGSHEEVALRDLLGEPPRGER